MILDLKIDSNKPKEEIEQQLLRYAVIYTKEFMGMAYDGDIKLNGLMLNSQKFGQYLPDTNIIMLSHDLIKLCQKDSNPYKGYLAVLEHELVHWFAIKNKITPYDKTTSFENMLKSVGGITNHNMANASKVILTIGGVRPTHCKICSRKLFDLIETQDYKVPYKSMSGFCECSEPTLFVNNQYNLIYYTYQYLLYDSFGYVLHSDRSLQNYNAYDKSSL